MEFHDAVSSATHLLTAVWAALATLVLLRLTRGHGFGRWAIVAYGLGMVLVYLASGTFHGLLYRASLRNDLTRPEAVAELWVWQKLDKSAIFLMIAGSFTPIFVYLLNGAWRKWSVVATATLAAVGIVMIWLPHPLPHRWLVAVYVGTGLAGLIPAPVYGRQIGWRGGKWVALLIGAYLIGALVEVVKWPVLVPGWFGPHEFLHVADVVGTLAHFVFVVRYVVCRPPLPDGHHVGKHRDLRPAPPRPWRGLRSWLTPPEIR